MVGILNGWYPCHACVGMGTKNTKNLKISIVPWPESHAGVRIARVSRIARPRYMRRLFCGSIRKMAETIKTRRTHWQALAHKRYRRMHYVSGDGEWLIMTKCHMSG